MAHLRKIMPLISFLLLIGFSMAMMEDTFYCSDEAAGETHAEGQTHATDEECCLQCLTVHNMAASKAPMVLATLNAPRFSSLFIFKSALHSDPHPSHIERPPITALS